MKDCIKKDDEGSILFPHRLLVRIQIGAVFALPFESFICQ